MKKLNWKSLIPLAITIFAPVITQKLQPVGVRIAPAVFAPTWPLLLILVSPESLAGLLQTGGTLLGGIFANGAFRRGQLDFTTNTLGIVGALGVLLGAFGLHVAPDVQQALGAFISLLIVTFSAHPAHDAEGANELT